MKYKLIMQDNKTGEWKEICTSGNKGYLDDIAAGLEQDGELCRVEELEASDVEN